MVCRSQRKKNIKAAKDLLQIAEDDEESGMVEAEILEKRIEQSFGHILFDDDDKMGFLTNMLFNDVTNAEYLLEILDKL